ncbi:putative secreted protein [Mesorhizobium sp. J18]|uniref:DUF1467 family protein n=1 Tax=Mesorhizobium sp. J18 TaxID=935263 RepID=UPI00119986A5|nr:DUF1467 family protein [Mesorhizobium sp. J18]TWG95440.1 putative secreted protein [Mesorhizobium sp. J18]
MSWVSIAAIFFIIWWVVLFAALPIGLRTQDEDENVTLGTVPSAPRGPHMLRAFIRATIIALIVFGIFYGIPRLTGFTFDDIPRIVPSFE